MNTKTVVNLQDSFLNQIRKENVPVTVYLMNGFQLRGAVKGFDNFTVLLDSEGKQMLLYKHAISTITPVRPVNIGPFEPPDKPKDEARPANPG